MTHYLDPNEACGRASGLMLRSLSRRLSDAISAIAHADSLIAGLCAEWRSSDPIVTAMEVGSNRHIAVLDLHALPGLMEEFDAGARDAIAAIRAFLPILEEADSTDSSDYLDALDEWEEESERAYDPTDTPEWLHRRGD